MLQRPPECFSCDLHTSGKAIGFMHPEGTGSLNVAVMAEALGGHEAADGLPLRPNAPAGSVWHQILRRAGVDPQQLTTFNTIFCQPGVSNWLDGAPYEFSAIRSCQVHRNRVIRERQPKAILALGNIATRTLTGLAGHKLGIKMVRGFIHPAQDYVMYDKDSLEGSPIPIIPTYHPSFLLRGSKTRSKDSGGKTEKGEGGMALAGVVRRDLELAIQVARSGWSRPSVNYVYAKEEKQVELFYQEALSHPKLPIAIDIETPESFDKSDDESEIERTSVAIKQIQFSLRKYEALVMPGFDVEWSKKWSRKICQLPNLKLTFNGWSFDEAILAMYEIWLAGEHHDLMWTWHHLQPDLPRGLQYVTSFYAPEMGIWKHLAGSDDEYYGGCDVDAPHRIFEGMSGALKDRGMWENYLRHVVHFHPILVRMSERGIPVNDDKREKFRDKIQEEADRYNLEIQGMIPDSVRNVNPKEGYVRCPKEVATSSSLNGTNKVEVGEVVYVYREFQVELKPKKNSGDLEDILSDPGTQSVWRWAKLLPFSGNSGDQIKRYILHKRQEEIDKRLAKGQDKATAERLAKYKVPIVKDKRTKINKETTEKKELLKLYKETGDRIFKLIIDWREITKMVSTFVEGWKPAADGYVHPEFLMAPATGQLSCVNPNAQNAPKHGDLGNEFRKVIEAKPDHVLLEFDKKAFHAQTLAFEAQDLDYLRLAKIDVHSFVAAHMTKHPEAGVCLGWSDDKLKAFLKDLRRDKKLYSMTSSEHPNGMTFQQIRDEKAKRTILGIGFGQGARSLYVQNEEYYESVKEIQAVLDLLKKLFPKTFAFQDRIRQLFHKQGYGLSRYKYIRRFHDVFKWDSRKWNPRSGTMGDWAPGDDSEAAIAFFPANDAFGEIREEMIVLEEKGWNEEYGLCNNLHDALKFHCPKYRARVAICNVIGEMSKPSKVLIDPIVAPGGLVVEVEGMIGRNWAKWSKENPGGMREISEEALSELVK